MFSAEVSVTLSWWGHPPLPDLNTPVGKVGLAALSFDLPSSLYAVHKPGHRPPFFPFFLLSRDIRRTVRPLRVPFFPSEVSYLFFTRIPNHHCLVFPAGDEATAVSVHCIPPVFSETMMLSSLWDADEVRYVYMSSTCHSAVFTLFPRMKYYFAASCRGSLCSLPPPDSVRCSLPLSLSEEALAGFGAHHWSRWMVHLFLPPPPTTLSLLGQRRISRPIGGGFGPA